MRKAPSFLGIQLEDVAKTHYQYLDIDQHSCYSPPFNLHLYIAKHHLPCRYHSLCAYMGDDDLFSSDLSDDQLKQRLGHMSNTPCQVTPSSGLSFIFSLDMLN